MGPSSRYALTAQLIAGDLYLHGGDDGGHFLGARSYRHSVWGDLWRLILTPRDGYTMHTWYRVYSVVSTTRVGLALLSPSLPSFPAQLPAHLPLDDLYLCQHGSALLPLSNHQAASMGLQQEGLGDD